MRDLLHWHDLGWGGPPGEGLVFALGGSLGLSYIRSSDLTPPLYLVGRDADFEVDLPRRLGASVEVLTTDDPAQGWSWVREDIDAGRPSLVWGDIAELPYLRVQLRMSRHDIVVIGYDVDREIAFVVDNDRAEVQEVPLAALARARASTSFPEPTRHRTFRIAWPAGLPDLSVVAGAAFRQSAASMRDCSQPGMVVLASSADRSEGLAAVERLAADTRTWVELPVEETEVLLFSLGAFIEKAGTGGGLFRRLLAEGSADIARLTGDRATAALAEAARRCADAWTQTARAGVQRDVDTHARAQAVALAAGELTALELALVEALETAAHSLSVGGPS